MILKKKERKKEKKRKKIKTRIQKLRFSLHHEIYNPSLTKKITTFLLITVGQNNIRVGYKVVATLL
jgi:hypothetical protein